jgi:hypothetical protein
MFLNRPIFVILFVLSISGVLHLSWLIASTYQCDAVGRFGPKSFRTGKMAVTPCNRKKGELVQGIGAYFEKSSRSRASCAAWRLANWSWRIASATYS